MQEKKQPIRVAQGKKAVVTGGAGFIGSHLVRELQSQGFDVVVVDIKTEGDVRDAKSLGEFFTGAQFVFHLAALPRVQYSIEHPEETHETNVTGTLNVLLAAKKANVERVIFSSSAAVYGDQEKMPLQEDMPPLPKSPYALHKYAGECYCRLFSEVYGLPTVSLRYFNVYGPGADPNGAYALVIAKFIQQRSEGKPLTITGDGTNTRDYVYVRDIARANMLAATGKQVGKGEVINIGSGTNASVNTIAQLVGGPTERIAPRLEPRDSRASTLRAEKLLGWEPQVNLKEGIAELKKLSGLS